MNPILSPDALRKMAAEGIGGIRAGHSLSMGYLAVANGALASAHLLSAWRPRSSGGIENTLPFQAIFVSLETGALITQSAIRGSDLGLHPSRVLPNDLDSHLPSSVPDERVSADSFVNTHTAQVWQAFREGHELATDLRETIRAYQCARMTGLRVQDLVFQEALHPTFAAWLGAA